MKLRDWLFYSLGVFTGATALLVYIVYLDWARFKKQTDELQRKNRARPIVQIFRRQDGKFKFLGVWGEKDPEGRRIFPKPEGRPIADARDDELFFVKEQGKLTPKQTWEELVRRYPDTLIDPDTGEQYPEDYIKEFIRKSFDERMRNRKRKKAKEGR